MPVIDLYLGLLVLVMAMAYRAIPAERGRLLLICAGSIAYLLYLDVRGVILALLVGLMAWWLTPWVRGVRAAGMRRFCLALAIGALVAPLVYYKYWGLVPALHSLIPKSGAELVPLGISFVTFRAIAYLVDQQHPKMDRPSVGQYAAFILFFPTFVAGPLARWTTFHKGPTVPLTVGEAGWALRRILYGVARKVIIADWLAWAVLKIDAGPIGPSGWKLYLLPFLYGAQIYFDFSAYSDIAIGLGRLFGYQIIENFNRPFLARNMVEFWRRWHISLSEWIRSYLFMPLATRRPSAFRLHLAVLVSMGLCGLWHGAGWNFLVWGLYHGVGLSACYLWRAIKQQTQWAKRLGQWRLSLVTDTALTYVYVNIGFILFFKPLPQAFDMMKRMVGVD